MRLNNSGFYRDYSKLIESQLNNFSIINFPTPYTIININDSLMKLNGKDFNNNEVSSRLDSILGFRASTVQTLTLTILVTGECTLRCSYCYEKKNKKVMSKQTARDIVDWILDSSKNFLDIGQEFLVLDFLGGEPLLNVEVIEEFISYFIIKSTKIDHRWRNKFMCDLCSNGTEFFNKNVFNFISKYKSIISFNISIDGPKEVHDSCRRYYKTNLGSFDDAFKAAKYLSNEYNVKSSKVTVSHNNIDTIAKSVMFLMDELNLNYLYCNTVYEDVWEPGDSIKLFNQLIQVIEWLLKDYKFLYKGVAFLLDMKPINSDINSVSLLKSWCGGTCAMGTFDSEGNITPCVRFSELSLESVPQILFSNIYDNYVNNNKISELSTTSALSQSDKKCLRCPIIKYCNYCCAVGYSESGIINNTRPLHVCTIQKSRYLASMIFRHKVNSILNLNLNLNLKFLGFSSQEIINVIGEDNYNEYFRFF